MKREDINYELISKLEIKVDDTQFYLPGETIKGKVLLNPQYKIKEETLHLTIKIMQYEFWDYVTKEIEELKNIYTSIIQEVIIEYDLEKEELPKKENVEGFENCSIIMKEDENKVISLPFEIKLDDKKILPTFQFENQEYFLGIRHLILVECKEYNSSNYTGLFIGKNKNIEMSEPKEIKESYWVGLGSLEIIANFPKLSIAPGEEINADIKTNSNLYFKKISKITQTFYRNIKWVGYMKNTLLDKTICSSQTYNTFERYNNKESEKSEFSLIEIVTAPIRPIVLTAAGLYYGSIGGYILCDFYEKKEEINLNLNIVGGILGAPIGMVCGFLKGIYDQGKMLVNGLSYMKGKEATTDNEVKNKITEKDKLQIIEDLKRFVYFKDDKVVGFIKFAQNITPNVNGYYFNCEYNMRIDVDIEGILLNRNKYLKSPIDIYDSEEYIAHMKNLFKN